MAKYLKIVSTTLLTFWMLLSCEKETGQPDAIFPIDCNIRQSRTFYMGFTAFPNDFTQEALIQSVQYQQQNVQKLLAEAHKLNAEFVAWFVYRDYNLLAQKIGVLPIWNDMGLMDGQENKRPTHQTWNQWKELPVIH